MGRFYLHRDWFQMSFLLFLFTYGSARAEDSAVSKSKLPVEELLSGAGDVHKLRPEQRHHYDDLGYPETKEGALALRIKNGEPVVYMRVEPEPYLLYAQYKNQQRDAVFLARSSAHSDTMPCT